MDRRGFLKALAAIPAAALLPLPVGATTPTSTAAVAVGGFQVGDVFSISGVYNINPVTMQSTGRKKLFVVTATTESGNIVTMAPKMYDSGPYQNVTNLPTTDSRIQPLYWGQSVPCEVECNWTTEPALCGSA